jgi:hypothetical protein
MVGSGQVRKSIQASTEETQEVKYQNADTSFTFLGNNKAVSGFIQYGEAVTEQNIIDR